MGLSLTAGMAAWGRHCIGGSRISVCSSVLWAWVFDDPTWYNVSPKIIFVLFNFGLQFVNVIHWVLTDLRTPFTLHENNAILVSAPAFESDIRGTLLRQFCLIFGQNSAEVMIKYLHLYTYCSSENQDETINASEILKGEQIAKSFCKVAFTWKHYLRCHRKLIQFRQNCFQKT